MPMHDWTKVEAGIFHAFHHRWISAISDALNQGSLPFGNRCRTTRSSFPPISH